MTLSELIESLDPVALGSEMHALVRELYPIWAASSRCILSNGLDSMGLPIATRYAISLRFGF